MRLAGWVVAFALGAAACATETTSATDDVDLTIDTSQIDDHVTVYDDRLEFDPAVVPALDRLHKTAERDEPIYYVGGRAKDALDRSGALRNDARNATGYLRRAIGFERRADGTLVVRTVPATLAEAIEDVKSRGLKSPTLRPRDDRPAETATGDHDITIHRAFGQDGSDRIAFDFSGTELFKRKLLLGGDAKVVIKRGRLELKPVVDASFSIRNFVPSKAEAILTSDVSGELEIEASGQGAFEVAKSQPLFGTAFGGSVQGLPVTLRVDVESSCNLGLSGAAVASAGATAKGNLRVGGTLAASGLTPIFDPPTYSFERIGPALNASLNASGNCHLIATLSMQLFDLAGPQGKVDMYADLQARGTATTAGARATASLKAGVEASVGGSLRPFGVSLGTISAPPLKLEREIFSGTIATP
jgi:hypothetical protein